MTVVALGHNNEWVHSGINRVLDTQNDNLAYQANTANPGYHIGEMVIFLIVRGHESQAIVQIFPENKSTM